MSVEQLAEKLQQIERLVEELRTEMRTLVEQAKAEKVEDAPPVKLFVGAKCERRDGEVVTISRYDVEYSYNGVPYPFYAGSMDYYREDGAYLIGQTHRRDIVRVLNPEDHPDNKQQPVELFIGAKCERRNGEIVTIEKRDDSYRLGGNAYPFQSNDGQTYTEDGAFMVGCEYPFDIIRVLNHEGHPDNRPPVEYRDVNFTDIGKYVYGRDNREIAGTLGGFGRFPNGSPAAFVFASDGGSYEAFPSSLVTLKSPDDRVVHEEWMNVYPDNHQAFHHPSKEKADAIAGPNRIACIRVQYYKGQMDA